MQELGYSKVAGLQQFFPKKSADTYFVENLWVAASDVSCIHITEGIKSSDN